MLSAVLPKSMQKLGPRLIFLFCLAGITPLLVGSLLTYNTADHALNKASRLSEEALERQASEQMQSLARQQQIAVERYFQTARKQMMTFAGNAMVVDTMRRLSKAYHGFAEDITIRPDGAPDSGQMLEGLSSYYRQHYNGNEAKQLRPDDYLGSLDPKSMALQYVFVAENPSEFGNKEALIDTQNFSPYEVLHKRIHPAFVNVTKNLGYDDILLVTADLAVGYSVTKGPEFATQLNDGYFANSHFGKIAREALAQTSPDAILIADFEPYAANQGKPYGFMASPIFHREKNIGAVVFKLSLESINEVMLSSLNANDSSNAYLVGPDGKLRSDSSKGGQSFTVHDAFSADSDFDLRTSPQVQRALAGETGIMHSENLLGEPSLSAYSSVDVGSGLTWAMVAEVPLTHALAAVAELQESAEKTTASFRHQVIWTVVLSAVVILLTAWFTAESVVRPLRSMLDNLRDLARGEGNLEARLPASSNDEVGDVARAFNAFVEKLQSTIIEALGVLRPLAEASNHIQHSSRNMVDGTDRQARALSDTTRSIEDITRSIELNTEAANRTEDATRTTTRSADEASEIVKAAVESMNEITQSSNKMVEITTTIEEIAFQTNLLALNAAVEAARAGDQGKGFAVVANEVRNLAGRSAEASKEIRLLIEESVERIARGSALVNQSGEHLSTIFDSVNNMSGMVSDIAISSLQQSGRVVNVRESVDEMDKVVKENVERAATLLNLANQLDSSSQQLSETLCRFNVGADHCNSDTSGRAGARLPIDIPHTSQHSSHHDQHSQELAGSR